jgi:regulatory LuxR family protein
MCQSASGGSAAPHLHQAFLGCRTAPRPGARADPAADRPAAPLVADGHTNAQIARRLGVAARTVRTHLENIYERLQVSSRTAAVLHASRIG